jgi:carboxyl-terminal processing protease
MRTHQIVAVAAVVLGACSQPSSNDAPAPAAAPVTTLASAPAPAPATAGSSSPSKSKDEWDEPFTVQTEPFGDGDKAFATAKSTLLAKYYATGLTEDDLYRAAVRGMLEDVDARMHKWNKLLAPSELALIQSDLKGELVGIGVRINYDDATARVEILATIAGSPAEKAGLKARDIIVSLNGKSLHGRTLADVVRDIRGKAGEPVTLGVLRDDAIVPFTIVRGTVPVNEVDHFAKDGVGYLSIGMFSSKTVSQMRAALGDLAANGARALVVDLRHNHGGSFDEAVHAAELLVPSAATIVSLEKRDGRGTKTEVLTSKGEPLLATAPLVVLVDHETSSGAELLAAALSEDRHARLVGQRTFGKWSVQSLDELGNGYAMKYTTALFHAPSGQSYDGVGLAPDVEVDMPGDQVERASLLTDPAARLAADVQLRTAIALLKP